MAGRFTLPTPSAYDSSGNPLAGGKLFFYESGTSTPLDTYSDDNLSTANANPVVADSAGRWGDIFLKDQDYKVILKDSDDTTIDTWDPVRAAEPTSTATRAITTTDTLVASDNGKLILADATSGAFTFTLLSAATAGDGFTVYIKKVDSSANAVTVDADGSELIDGDSDVSLPGQWDVVGVRSNGTAWRAIVLPLVRQNLPLIQGGISGLIISNNATDADHDIDITAGMCRDGADGVNMTLSASLTKRIDAAWAVGNGNGGLDTGTVANTTGYFVWLIRRSDTGVVDALFSTSVSAPTMPTNYDQKRLIDWVKTDSSANILGFTAYETAGGGIEFAWDDPPLDVSLTNTLTTSRRLDALSVPVGLSVIANINVSTTDASTAYTVTILNPDHNDEAPATGAGPLSTLRAEVGERAQHNMRVRTNTSAQIASRATLATVDDYYISTLSFEWSRR